MREPNDAPPLAAAHAARREPASSAHARRHLRLDLQSVGRAASALGDAEIVLAELVDNAVQHGAPDAAGMIEISWSGRRVIAQLDFSGGRAASPALPEDLFAAE
jgi:hypothetical protein